MNPLQQLHAAGQAVWLDSIRRSYLAPDGYLPRLIAAGEVSGLTSNPSIFAAAIAQDDEYAPAVAEAAGGDAREVLWALMKADIRAACDAFADLHATGESHRGMVSIEVDPAAAFDTERTVADGLELWQQIDRPNLMVKVPGTEPGLEAITRLTAAGVNVNVTLLFSVERYRAVMDAYLAGVRRRLEAGEDPDVTSVASFFVSRVDSKVDAQLPADHELRGTAAIANARLAYAAFREVFAGPEWEELAAAGARLQWPLWASTSTKDPAYPDTMYVDELVAPDTVTTVPESTLDAFRDHGRVADAVTGRGAEAQATLDRLAGEGIDLRQITKELETEGVEKFIASFEEAVATVAGALG